MRARPLHHTFAPLADATQRRLALGLLLRPDRRDRPADVDALRNWLSERFDMHVSLFAAGREALCALFQAMQLRAGDEVLVQGYTCVVVPNAIHAAGGNCVYVDIDPATLGMDVGDVERRITPRTRAVVCQHTFGIPADTERLRALCDRHKVLLVEDCAHVLPDNAGPAAVGRYGHALLLSFGRDKAVSGVTGGALLVRDAVLGAGLRAREASAATLPRGMVTRLLLYPLLYGLALPVYGLGAGKALLALAGRLRLLPPIVTRDEKRGIMPPLQHKLPGAFATLALAQLRCLPALNALRRDRTRQYLQACKDRGWKPLEGVTHDLPLQKFPLFAQNAQAIRDTLKQRNIHLEDGWTGCVVCPGDVDPEAAGYAKGSDPEAEASCLRILSLPTHPRTSEADAATLVAALSPLLRQ